MTLFVIKCNFQACTNGKPVGEVVRGLAICSDADTPVTFIYPNGMPYTGRDIWNYRLHRDEPWVKLD